MLAKQASEIVFAPDGQHAVIQTSGTADRGLNVVDLRGAEAPRHYVTSTQEVLPMAFSPDGRYFAYVSFRSGNPRVYVRRFPTGSEEWEVPGVGTGRIAWPAGGQRIFAVTGERRELALSAFTFEGVAAPVFGRPAKLFTTTSDQLSLIDGLAAAPDGRSFLTIRPQQAGPAVNGIVVVQNWLAEFQRR